MARAPVVHAYDFVIVVAVIHDGVELHPGLRRERSGGDVDAGLLHRSDPGRVLESLHRVEFRHQETGSDQDLR